MIRAARAGDIPAVVDIITEAYEKSVYAGVTDMDVAATKRLLLQSVHRNLQTVEGGTFFAVCDRDGQVCAFILGALDRCYLIGKDLQATDLFWISGPKARAKDGVSLFKKFVAWAEKNPRVVEITVGTTGASGEDFEKAGRLVLRQGFEQYGNIYRKARTDERDC